MNTDSTTLYKLMILYMLSKVNFPLSNTQLSSFMLDKQYTDYFTFQETTLWLRTALLEATRIRAAHIILSLKKVKKLLHFSTPRYQLPYVMI